MTATESETVGEHDSVTVCGRDYSIQSPWPAEKSKEGKEGRAEKI